MKDSIKKLKKENELLKSSLLNNTLIHELTKVLHLSQDIKSAIKTFLLGLHEIFKFDRIILFVVDKNNFLLKPESYLGIKEDIKLDNLKIPLGFAGGDITDSIFLNRHILVENPASTDPFYIILNSKVYLTIPITPRLFKKCWEVRKCSKTSCPAYKSVNPYCWSIRGCCLIKNYKTEDERRKVCVKCPSFKADFVLWMDRGIRNAPITGEDISLITASVNMAGIIFDNIKMYKELKKSIKKEMRANAKLTKTNKELKNAQAKIDKDLEHARIIQHSLLPQNIEISPEIKKGSFYCSADAVGGDYYDIFKIDEGIYGVVVADVSGHGTAAALIMSMGKILLKTFSKEEISPQKTLEKINKIFLSEVITEHFVTFFYAIVDINNTTLRFTSAGHCPILMLNKTNNEIKEIKADGLFLGVFEDIMLKESLFSYEKDTLRMILYTDGLTEARNEKEEMYGIERLKNITQKTIHLSPKKVVNKIIEDQKNFCGPNMPIEDDITLLIVDL